MVQATLGTRGITAGFFPFPTCWRRTTNDSAAVSALGALAGGRGRSEDHAFGTM